MYIELKPLDLLVLLVIERNPDGARRLRIDSEIDAIGRDRGAELFNAPGAGNELGTAHRCALK
ncbi:hypothetical protein D3C71_2007830 [compost metagenome]